MVYWLISAGLFAVVPITRPLGMNGTQAVVSGILLVSIFWWSTARFGRNWISCFLLAGFVAFSGVHARQIFTFPLSETFPLLVLTYVFSRAIQNSGLAEMFLEPILFRFADRPWKAMAAVVVMFALTLYAIPQPLARLIIIADIFSHFLGQTDCREEAKKVLMFSVFAIYVFINCTTMKADMIINTTIAAVAGVTFGDMGWIRYMAVPSLLYLAVLIVLLHLLFQRELGGTVLSVKSPNTGIRPGKKDMAVLAVLLATVLLWMTEAVHGIPAWAVTLFSVVALSVMGQLSVKDVGAIDATTLLFLTAAMSIGGVMKETGIADLVFRWLGRGITNSSPLGCIGVITMVTMAMHMVLGSNTTTLSVVTPGMVVMCGQTLPREIIMCVISVTLATQWILPFHSVGMMIGVSKGYFETRYMTRTGVVLTVLLFGAIFGLYVPWWLWLHVI